MQTQPNIETKAERRLWRQLMQAWTSGYGASQFEVAAHYTRKYPGNFWGWIVLADILVHLAQYKAAHAALARGERLAPLECRAHICAQWGHLYNASCNLRQAEKWYRRAVEHQPDTPRLIFLGAVLAKQGRFAEAKRCHRRAAVLATCPPDEAYFNLGLVLRAERRYAQAARAFERAIQIDPHGKLAKEALKDVQMASKLKRKG